MKAVEHLTLEVAALRAELAAERAQRQALARRLDALEVRQRPRDRADVRVLAALARVLVGTRFTAREVCTLADTVPGLREALDMAAVADSPRALGRLLRRCAGVPFDGWLLQCVGTDRDGLVWRVSRVSATPAADL